MKQYGKCESNFSFIWYLQSHAIETVIQEIGRILRLLGGENHSA